MRIVITLQLIFVKAVSCEREILRFYLGYATRDRIVRECALLGARAVPQSKIYFTVASERGILFRMYSFRDREVSSDRRDGFDREPTAFSSRKGNRRVRRFEWFPRMAESSREPSNRADDAERSLPRGSHPNRSRTSSPFYRRRRARSRAFRNFERRVAFSLKLSTGSRQSASDHRVMFIKPRGTRFAGDQEAIRGWKHRSRRVSTREHGRTRRRFARDDSRRRRGLNRPRSPSVTSNVAVAAASARNRSAYSADGDDDGGDDARWTSSDDAAADSTGGACSSGWSSRRSSVRRLCLQHRDRKTGSDSSLTGFAGRVKGQHSRCRDKQSHSNATVALYYCTINTLRAACTIRGTRPIVPRKYFL